MGRVLVGVGWVGGVVISGNRVRVAGVGSRWEVKNDFVEDEEWRNLVRGYDAPKPQTEEVER